ncbi:MAG: T9SS type A sorting domain-containing protein [Bacteroidota bacterium]
MDSTTTFSVTITNANGCSVTGTVKIIVEPKKTGGRLGAELIDGEPIIIVSPNPTQDKFELNISAPNDLLKGYHILSATGAQLLYQPIDNQRKYSEMVSVEKLATGVYFINIITERRKFVRKIIKH